MASEDHPYGQPDPADRSQRPPEFFDSAFGQPNRPDDSNQQYDRPDHYGRPDPYGRPDQYGRPEQYGRPDQYGRPEQYDRPEQYAQYDPRYDYGSEQPGRSRGTLVAIFVGLGVVGLVVGVGAAKLVGGGGGNPDPSALRPAAAVTTTSTAQQPVSTSADTAEPTPSETKTTTTAPAQRADYTPIGLNASAQKGLDFGFLTKVSKQNGTVSVRFDRATFYTGAAAIKHNGGVPPDDDYVIENTNPELRTFVVDPKASIVATNRLMDHSDNVGQQEVLTLDQFVANSQAAVKSGGVPVWLRHLNGLTGPVTALSEQFVP